MTTGYFKIPDEVIERYGRRIGVYGLAVLTVIARHLDAEGFCTLPQAQIGESIGASRFAVMDALKTLCEVGLLAKVTCKGQASRYQVGWQWDAAGHCIELTHDGVLLKTTGGCSSQLQVPVAHSNMLLKTTGGCSSQLQVGEGSPSSPALPVSPDPSSHPTPIIPSLEVSAGDISPLTPQGERHSLESEVPESAVLVSASRAKAEETKRIKADFERWYMAYPKKKNRGQAEKAFLSLRPSPELVERMIGAVYATIEAAKKNPDHPWRRDAGQFIPYPATWVRATSWEDCEEISLPAYDPQGRASPAKPAGPDPEKLAALDAALARSKKPAGPPKEAGGVPPPDDVLRQLESLGFRRNRQEAPAPRGDGGLEHIGKS